jgi:hypothetical protein
MKQETFIRAGLPVHVTVVDTVEEILPAIFANAEPQSAAKEDAVLQRF